MEEMAGTLHLASVWSAARRSRLYSVGNANIDNFRSRCTRYRVCDAGRAEGLASQPPSPGVQGAGSKHMCVGLPTAIFSGHICQFQNTTTIMQVWCLHLSPPTYFSSPARRMTRRTDRWQARNPERTAGCRRHPVRRQEIQVCRLGHFHSKEAAPDLGAQSAPYDRQEHS